MNRREFLDHGMRYAAAAGTLSLTGAAATIFTGGERSEAGDLPAPDSPAAGKPQTAVITSPRFKLHDTGPGHPEQPARIDTIVNKLRETPDLQKRIRLLEPRAAEQVSLLHCHPADYLAIVERDVAALKPGEVRSLSTGDVQISPDSRDAALLAAGAACQATDMVIRGDVNNAFCIARPPGHHARPSQGMGFCLYNNIAIAARHAQRQHGLDKVLIVDWDVHHGNGTQDIFYDDPTVFFFSTHQAPWYPGTGRADETGEAKAKGTNLNCPYPAGSGREQVVKQAFEGKLAKAADRFKPDLVLISAGFDSRVDDPLGRFTLDDQDFADLTTLMMQIADAHAQGRVVSCLEGGYNLEGLARAAQAHTQTLAGP